MTDVNTILSTMTISERRLKHTLGVAEAAKELAKTHFPELDLKSVELAAIMHDYTKEYPLERHLELFSLFGIEVSEDDIINHKLLHGKTAALIARHDFGLDEETCSAIYWHTTGRPEMTPFEIVIYLGDYIEEFRDDASCIQLRDFYKKSLSKDGKRTALVKTLVRSFDTTLKHLIASEKNIDENTIKARNFYLKQLNEITKG